MMKNAREKRNLLLVELDCRSASKNVEDALHDARRARARRRRRVGRRDRARIDEAPPQLAILLPQLADFRHQAAKCA